MAIEPQKQKVVYIHSAKGKKLSSSGNNEICESQIV